MRLAAVTVLAAGLLAGSLTAAAALDRPTGPVILTVTGAISETNAEGKAEFDLKMLDALAQRVTRTETPWTKGTIEFTGPLGTALLDAVGAHGTTLKIAALNDYAADVPVADFTSLPVIFATRMDGEPISVREKGPIFLIYPFSENPDIYNEIYFNRSVWQIASIEVH